MCAPSMPPPPDPKQTAGAQTATNIGTAIANTQMQNVNQVTPDGSLEYNQSGTYTYTDPNTGQEHEIPQFTATTSLSPTNKKIYDQTLNTKSILSGAGEQQAHRLAGHLAQGIDGKGLPNAPRAAAAAPNVTTKFGPAGKITRTYGGDYEASRDRVENALMERMDKRFDRDREALRTRLVNQGISEGSEAWSNAMGDFQSGVNDARLGAVLAGGQEQSRLDDLEARRAGFQNAAQQQAFNNQFQRASFANTAKGQQFNMDAARIDQQGNLRKDALNERFALRNQPINEISALLSGSQINMPNFQPNQPSGIPTVDYAGLVNQNYNQQLANYNQRNAYNQSILGGLFGLGSAGIMGGLFG